jgi:GT2 family glycosyltransferase
LPWLEHSIASVMAQSYPEWELWLCNTESSLSIRSILERYISQDRRIQIVSVPAVAALTSALAEALSRATGEFIGLLRQHDTLAPEALYEVVRHLQDASADIAYSDEDMLDARGRRSLPFFKPDWSPDLCWSSLYACHFGVYRRSVIETAGGFRQDSGEGWVYDLLLRCTEQSQHVVHVPRVLYHARQSPEKLRQRFSHPLTSKRLTGSLHVSAKQALADALARRGVAATVEDGPTPSTFRVRRQLQESPLVTIIIPTRDRLPLLRRCLDSITTRTTYRHYEILIIDNGSREPATLAYFASLPHQVVRDDGPFNFARLNNRAAAVAHGEHLLFLNNDMEVISPEWLEALLEHAQRREVGAVGALLLYADDTIQHAGVVVGMRGIAGHAQKYQPIRQSGYGFFPHLIRNYSAVTAACLMTRKTVYEEVGGMEEQLAVTFNDVDLCLRLRACGYLIVYTPYARLYHHEGQSRWYQPARPAEVHYMLEHWGPVLARDPYYHPHLTLSREDFSFALARAREVPGSLRDCALSWR